MRIRTQLASMKRTLGTNDAPDDEDHMRMLIDLAARRDSLFYPWRHVDNLSGEHFYPLIQELQRGYLAGTIGIEAKASGQADWKRSHYTRRKLVELGYATAARKSGQVVGLFVSELGDAVVQAIVDGGDAVPFHSRVILELLSRCRSLSESKLFQRELAGNPQDWSELTEHTLPLLHRGMIAADFDTVGRVFYGYRLADPPSDEIETNQPVRPWAFDTYIESYNAERMRLASLSYEGQSLYIPLPSTGAGNCFCSVDVGHEYGPGELRAEMLRASQLPKGNDHAENA